MTNNEEEDKINNRDFDIIKDNNKLTYEEKSAIQSYISSEAYKINYAIRENEELTEEQKLICKNLDKAL